MDKIILHVGKIEKIIMQYALIKKSFIKTTDIGDNAFIVQRGNRIVKYYYTDDDKINKNKPSKERLYFLIEELQNG